MIRYLILVLCVPVFLFSQDNQNNANQPLDLQEFVITGKASADVKGGTKQKPNKPSLLSKAELDSINTNNKIPSPLLLSVPLPLSPLKPYSVKGYAGLEFGLFATPLIKAGYSFNAGGYSVDVLGNYEGSSGHIDNAGYSKLGLSLHASYDAPSKFIFFGGSRTESGVMFARKTYTLFGADKANVFDRSVQSIGAIVDIKGNYNEFNYKAGAHWNSLSLETQDASRNDSRIMGYLQVQKPWNKYIVSTSLMLDLHSLADNAYNFMEFGGSAEWNEGDMTIKTGAAIQSALSSADESIMALNVHGTLHYHLHNTMTASMEIRTGLKNASLQEYMDLNPYIVDTAIISFRKDNIRIKPSLLYHPSIDFSASVSAEYVSSSSLPLMIPNSNESGKFSGFVLEYGGGSSLEFSSEALYKPYNHTVIAGMISYTSSVLTDYDAAIPLLPSLKSGFRYERKWPDNITSQVSMEFIGSRTVDREGLIELPSYIMLNARVQYMIQPNLETYVRLDNLLNSSVYLWNRYKERGTFVAVGIRYTI